jgi:hypothetical protein
MHAVDVSIVLAISVGQTVIVSDAYLKKMEEVCTYGCSEHNVTSSDASLRVHAALIHPAFKICRITSGLHLGIVEIILDRSRRILRESGSVYILG